MYKVFDYCESLETLDFPSNVFFFGNEFQGNPRPPITYLTGLKTITLPVLCFVGTDKFPYDEKPNPYFIADFKNSKNLTTIISKILDPTNIQLRRTKFRDLRKSDAESTCRNSSFLKKVDFVWWIY